MQTFLSALGTSSRPSRRSSSSISLSWRHLVSGANLPIFVSHEHSDSHDSPTNLATNLTSEQFLKQSRARDPRSGQFQDLVLEAPPASEDLVRWLSLRALLPRQCCSGFASRSYCIMIIYCISLLYTILYYVILYYITVYYLVLSRASEQFPPPE